MHDFVIPELGRAAPYGVYDIAGNAGWVSVGIDHDTASFAVNAIRSWWQTMGRERYPNARSSDHRRWRRQQRLARPTVEARAAKLADELGLAITVCHLPPGTSKWNKIEHRLFSFITQLARQAARQPSGHRPTDRRHDDQDRSDGALRTRPQHLSGRHQGLRCRNARHQHLTPRLPRRMELHHLPATADPER